MNILNSKRFQQAETEEGYFVLEPAFIREALEGGVEFGTVQFFVYMYMRWCEVFGKYRVLFAGKKHIAEHIGATEKEVENALDRLKRKGLVQYIDFQVNILRAKQKFWVSMVRLGQVQQKAPTQVGGVPTQVGGVPTQVGGGLSVPPQSEDNNIRKEYKNNTGDKSPKSKKKKVFIPPTVEEVEAYCKEKGYSIDPKLFVEYYEAGDWKDKNGLPVKSWKQRVVTWERHSLNQTPPSGGSNANNFRVPQNDGWADGF